tara:strand:+ start:3146 stop:3289 length:144 start_codon:yes stop_codon:yes gene_type:complete
LVPSSVGFITLFGVAVLNGVAMVESINAEIKSAFLQAGNKTALLNYL